MNDEDMASVAKALAHPARVQIVRLLASQTECRGAEIFGELSLAQSTVSEHLRVLRQAGVVHATPVGTRTLYCLVPEALERFGRSIQALVDALPHCPGATDG